MRLDKIEKATAKNNKSYHKLTVDGKLYNYFGELGELKEGDGVVCTFETKGEYTNLKTIAKGSNAQNTQLEPCTAQIVLTRADKPHSYEWGKASARHKVYYNTVEELKAHIAALELAGFYAENDIFETQKIN